MTVAHRIALFALLMVCGAFPVLAANNVFSLPESPFQPNVPYYGVNPFVGPNTLSAAPGPVAVLAKPDGSKHYVVSATTTDTILVMDGSLANVLRRVNLAQPARAAALTPDGARLLVLADTLHVFDTTTANDDEVALSPIPDVGLNPNDVAVSIDSKRAYIISDDSDQFTMFDLTTNMVASQLALSGVLTGVAVAPSGLVYVSGTNRFYEIDGYSGVKRGEISLNSRPDKAVFTRDGKYAVLVNKLPTTLNDGVAVLIDLKTRSVAANIPATGANLGVRLDHLTAVDDARMFAVSVNNQRLVQVNMNPFSLQTIGFPLDTRTGVLVARASNELPAARYLFAGTTDKLSRVVLASSQLQDLTLPEMPRRLLIAGTPSTATPVGVQKFNDGQNVLGGQTTLPLVLQIWDSNGLPVFNRSVQFSSTTAGVTIETASTTTNVDGMAGTRVTMPAVPGTHTITANVNGLSSPVDFQVVVAGGGGGGGGGGVSILSGNGQIVPRGFPTTLPLKVLVRDAHGQPIIGAEVSWTLNGQGILSPPSGVGGATAKTLTDIDGVSYLTYVGPSFVPPTTSWIQSTVDATASGLNTVTFTVTAVPNLPDGNPAIPTIFLTKPPQADRSLSGAAGQTITGGIEFQVNAIAGFSSGQGIPGIGVEIEQPADPSTTPSAACSSPTALSDATGLGKCDVVFGGALGVSQARVIIGGLRDFLVTLNVAAGPPGLIKILGGNNQSGTPGQTLSVPLLAEISDGFGHVLSGVPVTWEVVVPGTVTLSNASATSNALGRVSATATLGATPGPVQVRLRAGAATPAVFTLNVNVAIGSFTKVSGDPQTAVVNTAFGQSLVVQVLDAQSAPVAGALVTFAVTSGTASLGSPAVTTDAQGRASTTVTAGSAAGPVVITASVPGVSNTLSFNLTVVPPGPVVQLTGIRSAISGDLGVSPGSIVAIYGDGLAPGIQGSVVGNNIFGPLPTILAGVEVLFGTVPAPIYHVSNVSGQQFVVVQAPFELAGLSTVNVTIKAGGGSTTVGNVPVKPYQPGIFETVVDGGQKHAVLLRPNGTPVSATNRAQKGERIRMFLAGLGQTTPALGTNHAGVAGQTVNAAPSIILGINYSGIPFVSVETMRDIVGVYVLTFDVPADAPSGTNIPLNMGILQTGGNPTIFSNTSAIHIQ